MASSAGEYAIRRATAQDSEALYRVCLLTGDSGKDGTDFYRDDPKALGRIYTQPYLELSPEFAFVLEDADGVCGYTLATLSSNKFWSSMESDYLPALRDAFPLDTTPTVGCTPAQSVHRSYHDAHDGHELPKSLVELFPSHLHIDLEPRAQGKGQGMLMMQRQLSALQDAGSRGVHLGMAVSNMRAYRFYKKLGFQELMRLPDGIVLGLRFESMVPSPSPTPHLECGVIEGFYGRPWSQEQRTELFERMAAWDMSLFMYGPKDDKKVRAAWRDLYTAPQLTQLSDQVRACRAGGIEFMYAIAPGLDIAHSDAEEIQLLVRKLQQLAGIGVTAFAILFDDIPEALSPTDAAAFSSQAEAQCAVANAAFLAVSDTIAEVSRHSPMSKAPRFVVCPTQYCGSMALPTVSDSGYVRVVGSQLLPHVQVFWTGPDVISREITAAHVEAVSNAFQRRLIIWDNLHANDYDNGRRVYLGPLSRRSTNLATWVDAVMTNPNCEYSANFVAFRTLSLFCRCVRESAEYSEVAAFDQATAEWATYLNDFASRAADAERNGDAGAARAGAGAGAGAGASTDTSSTKSQHVPAGGIAVSDLRDICSLHYLPWRLGDFGQSFVHDATEVVASVDAGTTTASAAEAFEAASLHVQRLHEIVTELEHRDTCYTLYRFMWDIKEEAELLSMFVQHSLSKGKEGSGKRGFSCHHHQPGTYRGGVVAMVQRLLVQDPHTGVFKAAATLREPPNAEGV